MDQLHNAFRRQLQIAGAEDLRYFADLTKRPSFKDLTLSRSGQPKRAVLLTAQLLECTLKAWQQVSAKCFAAAWHVCGYISKDEAVDLQAAARTLDPSGMAEAWGACDLAQPFVKHVKKVQWQVERPDGSFAVMPTPIANPGLMRRFFYVGRKKGSHNTAFGPPLVCLLCFSLEAKPYLFNLKE